MGEYATYNGQEIKIGTCEDMYYLRADQARKVRPISGNVNPVRDAGEIRFRFPFPDEDGIEPGAFKDFNRGLAVWGIEPPVDIDHYSIQFSNAAGLLVSLPCPESNDGKSAPYKIHRNGYGGPVKIVQQRLVDGQLKLVCQCGSCGAAYRCQTIEEAEPVIEALLKQVEEMKRVAERDRRPIDARARFFTEMAKRIVDGYTKPNAWTVSPQPVAA